MPARASRTLVLLLALAPLSAALAGPDEHDDAGGPALAERLDRLAAKLEREREKLHIPGMAIAVVKDDEVIFARGFGVTDVEAGTPVTPDTRFAAGSTTKAFTATIIGMLVDEGRMSWDDPVSRHVPYYHLTDPVADGQVVIRDLLCHRIGFAAMSVLWYGNDVTPEDVLRTSLRAELLHPFREKWNYSNESFLAAGIAAGAAAGADWHALLAERIFAPLGMKGSNTSRAAALADPLMSKGYIWDDEDEKLVHQPMRDIAPVAPAGAINSSVRDMAQWVRLQLGRGTIGGNRLLSEAQHEQTWTVHSTVSPGIDYGLGWFLRDWKGHRVIEHAGGIDGFTAEVAILPEHNLGFVLLMNLFAAPLQDASRSIVFDAILGDAPDPAVEGEDFTPLIGTYLANFATFRNTPCDVLVKDGALAIDIPGQMVFEMAPPDADGKRPFTMTDQIAVRFNRGESGEVHSLTIFQAGMEFELPRKGVAQPARDEVDRVAVARYLGRYKFEAMGIECTVLVQAGRLAVDIPGQMIFELRAPDADGRRAFAVSDAIWVAFNEAEGEPDGPRVASMTLNQDGVEYVLPYLGDPARGDLPTVDEIMAKVHAATGAARAAELGGYRGRGTVRFVHMGIDGAYRMLTAEGGRLRSEMDLGRFGRICTAIDGERAWVDSAFMGVDEIKGEARADLARSHPFALLHDWRRTWSAIEVTGAEDFDGRPVWTVQLDPASAPADTLYVDRETGFPLAMKSYPMTLAGVRFETMFRYGDYRAVAGVQIPHRMEAHTEVAGTIVMQLDEAAQDASIAVDEFRLEDAADGGT